MGQVERFVPRIYVSLEDIQEDHQSTMVEVEGNIVEQSVSVLIDHRSITIISLLELLIFLLLRR